MATTLRQVVYGFQGPGALHPFLEPILGTQVFEGGPDGMGNVVFAVRWPSAPSPPLKILHDAVCHDPCEWR